jgi:hypothetical protein
LGNVYVDEDVQSVIDLHADLFTADFRELPICEQLDRQARRICEAHQNGNHAAAIHVTCWHPDLVGHSAADIMKRELTLRDTRETIAREYGFKDWRDAETLGKHPPDAIFESAVDAVLAGNIKALEALLSEHPQLTQKHSDYGHAATLLHYCGSNGVETWRQVVPGNLPDIVRLLISNGADVNAAAGMYGGGCAPLALVITSKFPAEAGVVDDVVQIMVDAGAAMEDS